MEKAAAVALVSGFFTVKGNEKNLESTAIVTTVRSRSVHPSARVDPAQK
ncbi:hypothetical protein ACFTAO_03810 [Paenibacillus rhizoplanae]